MGTRETAADRARRRAAQLRLRLAEELREGRRTAGLRQQDVGSPCGLSRSMISRIERGRFSHPSLEDICCIADVLGLETSLRLYPAGDAIRDAAHAALLKRFRARLHPSLRWQTEVPLPTPGDRRAWDGMILGAGWRQPVEAETVIGDAQALERRLALKLRDGGFETLILVVADTERNRHALRAAPAAFGRFDLTPRQTLAALASGSQPKSSGIVIV